MNRYGVRYPNGTYSGAISPTAKDLKPYAREHHGAIYEAGTAEDPAPRHQCEAEPWDFADTTPDVRRIEPEDIAAAKADIENDTRKCYPEFNLSLKFGGTKWD